MSYFYPEGFNFGTESVDTSFNVEDFKMNYDYVMKGDLRFYASLVQPNVYLAPNYFQSILVTSINGLSDTVLSYLNGLSENVQDALNYLSVITTNINYDISENITTIEAHTTLDTCNANSLSTKSNITLSNISTKVISDSIVTNEVLTDTLICKTLKASNLYPVGCYLYFANGRTVPLIKSGVIKTVLPSLSGKTFDCEVTLMPGYAISFLNVRGTVLYVISSNTSDCLYGVSVSLSENPYKFNLYYENKII